MAEGRKTPLRPILFAFAPMHRLAMGVAGGVVLGGLIFVVTVIVLLKGGHPLGPNLALLGHFLFGYTVSWSGSIVGLVGGAGLGFIFGWTFALTRNFIYWLWLTAVRSRAEMEQSADLLDHL